MKTVNAYLFLNPEPVLIDCGEYSEASWEALKNGLADHGLKVEDLSRVIITHAHVDHIGMIGKIAANSDAEVWTSDLVYDWAVNLEEMRMRRVEAIEEVLKAYISDPNSPIRLMFKKIFGTFSQSWGSVSPDRVKRFGIREPLDFGGKTWQTLYTPGHSNTLSCFYHAESRAFLSSDMLIKITPTPVIEANPDPPHQRIPALPQMIQSYHEVAKLDIGTVYPGHYEVFDDAQELIQNQLDRIELRKEQCLQLIQSGHQDLMSLGQQMYGSRMSMPAIPMLVGYLDLLLLDEKIEAKPEKEGLVFSPI